MQEYRTVLRNGMGMPLRKFSVNIVGPHDAASGKNKKHSKLNFTGSPNQAGTSRASSLPF
jgi:hypothetical protein